MDTGYKMACEPFFSEQRIIYAEQYLRDQGMNGLEICYMRQLWALLHFYSEYMKQGGDKQKGLERLKADADDLWQVFSWQPGFKQPKPDLGY